MNQDSRAVDEAVRTQNTLTQIAAEWEEWQRLRAAAVLDAIDRGLTPTAVARSLGVTVPAVRAIYQRAAAHRRYADDEQAEALAALRDVGEEFQAVTTRYDQAVAAREVAIVTAIDEGVSAPYLAQKLGVVRQQVGAIARRAHQQQAKKKPEEIHYIA
jgi:hypothetical protein